MVQPMLLLVLLMLIAMAAPPGWLQLNRPLGGIPAPVLTRAVQGPASACLVSKTAANRTNPEQKAGKDSTDTQPHA